MSSFVFCCFNKTLIKNNLGRKEFIWLTVYSPSLREVRMGIQAGPWRQELKQKPRRSVTYWLDLYGFLILPRLTCPGMTPAQWPWPSHIHQEFLPTGQSGGGSVSTLRSSFPRLSSWQKLAVTIDIPENKSVAHELSFQAFTTRVTLAGTLTQGAVTAWGWLWTWPSTCPSLAQSNVSVSNHWTASVQPRSLWVLELSSSAQAQILSLLAIEIWAGYLAYSVWLSSPFEFLFL